MSWAHICSNFFHSDSLVPLTWISWSGLSVGASPPMLKAMLFKHLPITVTRLAACLPQHFGLCPLRGETDGAIAGPVTIVRADPHHQGTLLAGTATALLYRSRDGAASWTALSFPAELRSTLHALMIDPARANVYLVAVTSENAAVCRTISERGRRRHVGTTARSAPKAGMVAGIVGCRLTRHRSRHRGWRLSDA